VTGFKKLVREEIQEYSISSDNYAEVLRKIPFLFSLRNDTF
jgi:hypothetical protein